jgi:LPXTG-motif cell wall-anchored protein
MKRQIFTLLMALVLATGVGLMAQTTGNTTAGTDQQVDQSGQPETGTGPDVDVDTGSEAEGAVDVDVNRTTDPDTAASGVDETGTLDQDDDMTDTDNLPETASEMPLLALIGLLSLAGAVIIRVVR